MLRARITPCLLIQDDGLVKTVKFKKPKYIGDPINAVKIFNEKEADELIVLDIDATSKGMEPNFKLISQLAVECRMPLCYGGGIKTSKDAKKIIALGVEKIAISSAAIDKPELIKEIANEVGNQSIVVVLDVKKKLIGKNYDVWTHNGMQNTKRCPIELASQFEALGVGEIVINSIDNDGVMKGYDLILAQRVRQATNLPLTFLGGAGHFQDINNLLNTCGVVGAAAGSLFVFKGIYKAVLINYPNFENKEKILSSVLDLLNNGS